jgi:hypothetical protein
MLDMASVMIKGLTRKIATPMPLAVPITNPTSKPSTMAMAAPCGDWFAAT